jgi:hypothetical protein
MTMRRRGAVALGFVIAGLCLVGTPAADGRVPHKKPKAQAVVEAVPDSRQLEQDLQHLEWPQFRSVVEAIPKLKADVDAYGPLGWKYVEARYRSYAWQKNIDKLDDTQKRQLAQLIRAARR